MKKTDKNRVSIVVPTYNEAKNVEQLASEIEDSIGDIYDYEIIFVDDNSPDGTAKIVSSMAKSQQNIHLIVRSGKLGLASAVVEGFNSSNSEYLVMMDSDLSHDPRHLIDVIRGLKHNDIVVGSRTVKGGQTIGWPKRRVISSKFATLLAKVILGLKTGDLTSGFAGFRRDTYIEVLPRLRPRGFKLVLEILVKAAPHTRVKEVPITFTDRVSGQSKFSMGEIVNFFVQCFRLRLYRK